MAETGRGVEPPRVARWILDRALGEEEGPVAAGELAESFRARVAQGGAPAARRWYRRQVAGFVIRAPLMRRTQGREEGRMGWFDDVVRDVLWALRGLRRRPTFTVIAVLTLALGIGANSAIFTLLQAHFFTPLPYQRPSDLVLLWETNRNSQDVTTVAPGNYYTWRDQAQSFADIAAFNVNTATLSDGDGPAERVTSSVVAPNFFDVLGSRPELGAGFDEASTRAADGRVVILGHGLWARRYGADPTIVGRDIRVNGLPYTVVGVMPTAFRQPERSLTWQRAELWRPLQLEDQRDDFNSRYLRTVARLRPGVTVDQARAEMNAMAARMAEAYPEQNGGRSILVRTLDEYLLGDARPTLLMLLGAGVAVFLVVCANVANLTLARGEERRREFALRAALGSGRSRLLRQLLVEGVVLALAGAAVGTVMVYGAQGVLQAVQARFFSGLVDVRVDLLVVAFTSLAALAAGVLFGLPVARVASRADVREALVEGGDRSGARRGAGATRNVLVVGQVGLATTLLVVAALLTRSFNELVSVPPGFQPEGVLTFDLSVPRDREGREGTLGYYREVLSELEAIPGIAEVGMVTDMPFTTENRWTELALQDRIVDPTDPPRAEYHVATPEYFEVMGIPLMAGSLPERDWDSRRPIPVLVNQQMAQELWPQRDAVGATFALQWSDTIPVTVIGVVGNVLDDGFNAAPEPIFYVHYGSMVNRYMSLVVRLDGDPTEVSAAVRQAVARVDPDVPVADLRLLTSLLDETVVRPRAASLIGMAFGVLALLVAAAGIYGVLSYAVQSRTREIGIRAALGATGQQLVGMVMGHSTRLLLMGLVLGCAGALAGGRLLASLLFGVPVWDPVSLVGACALLSGVGTLAAWVPARRAVRADPKDALRAE